MWEDAMDRGFNVSAEIVVCPDCFDDPAIQNFIRTRGNKIPCTYCGTVDQGTCLLEELLWQEEDLGTLLDRRRSIKLHHQDAIQLFIRINRRVVCQEVRDLIIRAPCIM